MYERTAAPIVLLHGAMTKIMLLTWFLYAFYLLTFSLLAPSSHFRVVSWGFRRIAKSACVRSRRRSLGVPTILLPKTLSSSSFRKPVRILASTTILSTHRPLSSRCYTHPLTHASSIYPWHTSTNDEYNIGAGLKF